MGFHNFTELPTPPTVQEPMSVSEQDAQLSALRTEIEADGETLAEMARQQTQNQILALQNIPAYEQNGIRYRAPQSILNIVKKHLRAIKRHAGDGVPSKWNRWRIKKNYESLQGYAHIVRPETPCGACMEGMPVVIKIWDRCAGLREIFVHDLDSEKPECVQTRIEAVEWGYMGPRLSVVAPTSPPVQKVAEAEPVSIKETFSHIVLLSREYKVGERIGGKGGIYMGVWNPVDRQGRRFRKEFDLFVAPRDVTSALDLLQFDAGVVRVAGLQGFFGYRGANFKNDTQLYNSLEDGTYAGGWFLPTRDILMGTDVSGKCVNPDFNIYALRNKGEFQATFITTLKNGPYAARYMSCTEEEVDGPVVRNIRLTDGAEGWGLKKGSSMSLRVVRAELRNA